MRRSVQAARVTRRCRCTPEAVCEACQRGHAFRTHGPRKGRDLRYLYGIDLPAYERLLRFQSHQCAICGAKHAHEKGKRLVVDHDHETGDVRGLLCSTCNAGIGQIGERRLLLAAAYLQWYPTKAMQHPREAPLP